MENEPKKKNKSTIIIVAILCILVGMAPGYILGNKMLNKEEAKTEQKEQNKENKTEEEGKKNEELEEEKTEEPKQEEKKEETTDNTPQTEQKPETVSGKNAVIDLKNECFNSQECTKEYDINNGNKTVKVKIKANKTYKEMIINEESAIYDSGNDIIFKKVALLDNNVMVIETENKGPNGNSLNRYYLSENFSIIYENSQLDLREGDFKEDITAKEFTSYKGSITCGSNGIKQSIYKVKIISSDKIEMNLIDTKDNVYVPQC